MTARETATPGADRGRETGTAAGPDAPPPAPVSRRLSTRQVALRVGSIMLMIAISAGIIWYGPRLESLGAYGYPGLFLLNLLASATLILPAPGLALAFAAGASLSPWLVGLAVGSGSAIGELTGYVAGYSGRDAIKRDRDFERVGGWMRRYGLGAIFVLSLIPNPLFDVAGIISGVMHIPVWKFLAVTWCGKVLKATLVALAGAGMMGVLAPVIRQFMGR